MIFSAVCLVILIYRRGVDRWQYVAAVLGLMFLFVCVAFPGGLVCYLRYHNPVYPIKPFWPFSHGLYTTTLDDYRKLYNVLGLSPVVLPVYLLFAVGAGIDLFDKMIPLLHFFPMPLTKTQSLGWPYPMLFTVFLWPVILFVKRKKYGAEIFIVVLFIYQLVLWSLGLQYTRVFMASCALPIFVAVLFVDSGLFDHQNNKRLRGAVKVWFVVALVIQLMMQLWWFEKRFFGPVLATPDQRYAAEIKFLKTKDYVEENMLTRREASQLNELFLKNRKKPTLFIYSGASIDHILFSDKIYAMRWESYSDMAGKDFIIMNPYYIQKRGIKDIESIIKRYFPVEVMTTPDTHWKVFASESLRANFRTVQR